MRYLALILSSLFIFACAHQSKLTEDVKQSVDGKYTYIGIDPAEIVENWDLVAFVPMGSGIFELAFRNPDIDSSYTVAVAFVVWGVVEGYSYIYDGEIDVFLYRAETNSYESTYDKSNEELVQLWKDKYDRYFNLVKA